MSERKYYRSRAYHKAIEFISLNDGPDDCDALDIGAVSGLVTVVLASEVWNIPQQVVAADVVAFRAKAVEA